MNEVRIMGRLGKDPELKELSNGNKVCNFSVATSKKWTDKKTGEKKEKTEWHNCVAWQKPAELIAEYFSKGDGILVMGELETRNWQDDNNVKRYATEVLVSGFEFLPGSRTDRPTNTQLKNESQKTNTLAEALDAARNEFSDGLSVDDLPF